MTSNTPVEIHLDDPPPIGRIELFDRERAACEPGIIDEDVESRGLLLKLRNRVSDLARVRHIDPQLTDTVQLDWIQIEIPDLRTGISEPFSDPPTYAVVRASGDDGCSAGEIVANGHISPPMQP